MKKLKLVRDVYHPMLATSAKNAPKALGRVRSCQARLPYKKTHITAFVGRTAQAKAANARDLRSAFLHTDSTTNPGSTMTV